MCICLGSFCWRLPYSFLQCCISVLFFYSYSSTTLPKKENKTKTLSWFADLRLFIFPFQSRIKKEKKRTNQCCLLSTPAISSPPPRLVSCSVNKAERLATLSTALSLPRYSYIRCWFETLNRIVSEHNIEGFLGRINSTRKSSFDTEFRGQKNSNK